MLPIKSILYSFRLVYLVENPISIVLHCRGENYDFIDFCHLGEELITARSHKEGAFRAYFEVMDECLIKVKHQTILTIALYIGKIWRIWRL